MIRVPFLRAFSTARLGQVVSSNNQVALHVPSPVLQADIFARLKQHDRSAVLDKVERTLLWEQLSNTRRRLVFRPSRSQELTSADEPELLKFNVGHQEREVLALPKRFEGPPSLQDLRVVVLTSRTEEDVQNALDVLIECMRHKDTRGNVKHELFTALLRKAAAAGCFQSIYAQTTTERGLFEKFLDQEFYQEALRIYALRTPYLSHRSKNMFYRAYRRSSPSPSRDLIMIYALASYAEKFGKEHAQRLPVHIAKIAELKNLPKFVKKISLEDVALGLEGLRKSGVSEEDESMAILNALLIKRGRHRPQVGTLVVNLADQHSEEGGPVDEETP